MLKAYTKSWYGDDVAATAACVEHAVAAWRVLKTHGITVPDGVAQSRDCEYVLGRPFLMTRKLRGTSLTSVLLHADTDQFTALLETTGACVKQIHAIPFERSGYIMDGGISSARGPHAWHHWLWSAQQTQRDAFATLDSDRTRITSELATDLAARFATIETALAAAWQPPHFIHGDCHAE